MRVARRARAKENGAGQKRSPLANELLSSLTINVFFESKLIINYFDRWNSINRKLARLALDRVKSHLEIERNRAIGRDPRGSVADNSAAV